MANILCAKSGILFHCEYIPLQISTIHPFFSVPQKKLLSLAGVWSAGKLSEKESYLLFLALLDSTELIQWRTNAQYLPQLTPSIVANNMENLIQIIGKVNLIKHPQFTLPSFAITSDTCSLSNVKHWIGAWSNNYKEWYEDYLDSKERDILRDKLTNREEALHRLIKSSTPVETYASVLADWAAIAGKFPTGDTIHPITKTKISLAEYWKSLIKLVANEDKLWRFPRADIVELIDHCEDNIQHGNIYSHTLMKYLRKGLNMYDNYLGFADDVPPVKTTFTILPSSASTADINIAALASSAPEEEPQEKNYPNKFAWLKAYTRWKVSQLQGKE